MTLQTMDATYIEEVEKYINSFKNQIEDERKEIAECQKKFSSLLNAYSQKAPSNSVINSLFKDEEPEGFVFSKYEEKKKQLAEQRRAEYNAYLEKKEAERLSKKREREEIRSISPKSILDSVDYKRVLAKRKEEEAKFRTMNIADILHSSQPVLNENIRKPDLNLLNSPEHLPALTKSDTRSYPDMNLPGAITSPQDTNSQVPIFENKSSLEALQRENSRLLEEKMAKQLEEQRRQMLLEFDNELRKNNKIKEEIESMKTSSVTSSAQRVNTRFEDYPKMGRTGGGGEPVRDSYGNLITNRGLKKENNFDTGSIMSFPSMQQQPIKDRMSLYREELQKQNSRLLEEKMAKQLEEQRRQMLLEFDNELRKNNKIKEEIESMETSSVTSSPQRVNTRFEDYPKMGRTGGGGEPVRDSYGNLITNRGLKKENNFDTGSIMSFPSMQQQPIKDRMSLYREELQKQIEEKKRLEALEKAKAQELEDRIAQRIEEQRLKMQEEYENELKKNNKIKEEFQRQQERIKKLEEFQRKDAEARRKKFVEMKSPVPEKPQPTEVVNERSNSPPIPAVRTKVLLEKAVPPITEVKPDNVFSSLAQIRRKIMEEQQKPKKDFKNSYEVMNRRTVPDVDDDDEDDILKTSY